MLLIGCCILCSFVQVYCTNLVLRVIFSVCPDESALADS